MFLGKVRLRVWNKNTRFDKLGSKYEKKLKVDTSAKWLPMKSED